MPGRKECVLSEDLTDWEWYEHFKGVFNGSYTPGGDLVFENNDTSGENENLTELNRPSVSLGQTRRTGRD